MTRTSTFGSRSLARYRLFELERQGVAFDDPRMRAALGRWAARMDYEPPQETVAFRAYWAELLRYPLASIPEDGLDLTPLTKEETKQA